MIIPDDYRDYRDYSEIWKKTAGVWTILSALTFVAMLVVTVWVDGPVAKLWATWLILGVLGTFVLWIIADSKEGPL